LATEEPAELPPAIDGLIEQWSSKDLPPVHQWHPSESRTIDMRIAQNGDWFYAGSVIRRPRLVQLFASVLRLDEQGNTWLVTPGEKLRIQVDDAHFLAVLVDVEQHNGEPSLVFTTNVGERVIADAAHPINVQYASSDSDPAPYVLVRDGLRARLSRNVFLQIANQAEVRGDKAGVMSCGEFMVLGPAA